MKVTSLARICESVSLSHSYPLRSRPLDSDNSVRVLKRKGNVLWMKRTHFGLGPHCTSLSIGAATMVRLAKDTASPSYAFSQTTGAHGSNSIGWGGRTLSFDALSYDMWTLLSTLMMSCCSGTRLRPRVLRVLGNSAMTLRNDPMRL